MKKLFYLLLFLYVYNENYAQFLYLQDTYKGGVSVDGKSYYFYQYQDADTISFLNIVPIGSTIKKAFLLSQRVSWYYGLPVKNDSPISLIFNNNHIQIDSNDIADSYFNISQSSLNANWIVVKDVTQYAQFNGNTLITPCQTCSISSNHNWNYVYDSFQLVLLYENPFMLTTNAVILLNNQNLNSNMVFNFKGLNNINTNNDVGLSIWAIDLDCTIPINFILNQSFNIGNLYVPCNAIDNFNGNLPGSFYYQNNTLYGLNDDTPDAFIDSTDALVNIKGYVANSSTSFTLNATGRPNESDDIAAFVIAYTTPCPARSNKDTTYNYYICSNNSVQLAVNSSMVNTSYTWYATDGSLTTATTASVAVTPTTSTNYIAYVDSAGCKHTEHFSIAVTPSPKFDSVYVNNVICGGALGSVTVSPGYGGANTNYYYTVGNVHLQQSNTFSNLAVDTYSATVTDTRGCSYTKTFSITQTNPAVASFSINPTPACINEPVQFTNISSGTNLQWWNFGASLADTNTTQNPTYIYNDTGTYNITLIAYNNLRTCSDTLTKTIIVKDCPPDSISVIVPNIFSPNADDINEVWQLIVYNFNYTINNYQCTIYDRWGIKVFETSNLAQNWDGRTTSGLVCSAGAYYYIVNLTATNSKGVSENKDYKGYLELVR